MKRILFVCLLAFIPVISCAGPFGLEMGMKSDDLKKQIPIKLEISDDFIYGTKTAPKVHQDFVAFFLKITPENGLCNIRAFSKEIVTNVYGKQLLEKFAELEGVLIKKYGTPEHINPLKSKFQEPDHWLQDMERHKLTIKSIWKDSLPDNLSTIQLSAKVVESYKTQIELAYDFKNLNQCEAWIESQKLGRKSQSDMAL